jgi:hypothetical protein
MIKMQYFTIPKKTFLELLKTFYVTIKDSLMRTDYYVKKFILHANKDGLFARTVTDQNVFAFASVKAPDVVKIHNSGDIPIGNIDLIIDHVRLLGDTITVGMKENALIIADSNNWYSIPTFSLDFIANEEPFLYTSTEYHPFDEVPSLSAGEEGSDEYRKKEFTRKMKLKKGDTKKIASIVNTVCKEYYMITLEKDSENKKLIIKVGEFTNENAHGVHKFDIECDGGDFSERYITGISVICSALTEPELIAEQVTIDGDNCFTMFGRQKINGVYKAYYITPLEMEEEEEEDGKQSKDTNDS